MKMRVTRTRRIGKTDAGDAEDVRIDAGIGTKQWLTMRDANNQA